MSEYEPAAEVLRDFVEGGLAIRATQRSSNWPVFPQRRELVFDYLSYDGRLRLDETVVADGRDGRRDGSTLVRVAYGDDCFRASRPTADDAFALRSLHRDHQGELESIRTAFPIAFAAYCFREVTITEFFQDPAVRVVDMIAEEGDAGPLTKVVFEQGDAVKGFFHFAPHQHWACHGYWFGNDYDDAAPQPNGYRALVTYGKLESGFPLPSKYEIWRYTGSHEKLLHDVVDVEVIALADVTEADFTPAALGIPFGDAQQVNIAAWRWPFLLAGAVLLLLAYFVIKRRSSHA